MGIFLKLFFSFNIGSVVPINITIRLPDEEWTDELSNTTSESFKNLSQKLENTVSIRHLYNSFLFYIFFAWRTG